MPYKTLDELRDEAAAKTYAAQGFNRYNPFTERPKDENRYREDQQRLYVLDRLSQVEEPIAPVYDPDNLRKQLQSPTEPYALPGFSFAGSDGKRQDVPGQYLGEDSPAWKALTWMGSLPSAVYNTGRELGNQADRAVSYLSGIEPAEQYPGAGAKAIKDLTTFASVLPGPRGTNPSQPPERVESRWQDLEEMQEERAKQSKRSPYDPRYSDRIVQEKNPVDHIGGADLMEEARVPELFDSALNAIGLGAPGRGRTGAVVLGTIMDIVTDPFSSAFSAPALARLGKHGAALGELGVDAFIGAAPEVLTQYPGLLETIRRVPRVMDTGSLVRELIEETR